MIPIEPFTPRVLARTWGVEKIIASTPNYLGKVLLYIAGKAGGLQLHVEKDETFYLIAGEAWVDHDDGTGKLVRVKMEQGQSFHIPAGAPHRFEAITTCLVFEASTPHFDDRRRLEEQYGVEVIGDAYGLETTR